MANAETALGVDTLESRIEALEKKVFGPGELVCLQQPGSTGCAVRLTEMAKEFGNAVQRRDRIAPLFHKVNELEKYLDPSFAESKGMPLELKADLILANETRLRSSNALLKQLQEKKVLLDSDAFSQVSSMQHQLRQLSKLQMDQELSGDMLSQDTLDLIGQYNDILDNLSKAFMYYDQMITKAEQNKSHKDQ